MIDVGAIEATEAFHGHLCAELAMGIRAAEVALERLGRHGPGTELAAIVETDSCAVDAIQFLTGCTLGQGNLIQLDYGKFAFVFIRRSDGHGLRVSMCPGAWAPSDPEWDFVAARVRAGMASATQRQRFEALRYRRGRWVLGRPLAQLYEVAEVTLEPPPRTGGYHDADCDGCGEPTDGARLHRLHGRRLCSPCLDAAVEAAAPSGLRLPRR